METLSFREPWRAVHSAVCIIEQRLLLRVRETHSSGLVGAALEELRERRKSAIKPQRRSASERPSPPADPRAHVYVWVSVRERKLRGRPADVQGGHAALTDSAERIFRPAPRLLIQAHQRCATQPEARAVTWTRLSPSSGLSLGTSEAVTGQIKAPGSS
ncbi:hypothetical protein MHYP_G00040560 [Metynnis hypsauchen]